MSGVASTPEEREALAAARALRDVLRAEAQEREEASDALLYALLARASVLLIGPPGCGRRALAARLFDRILGAKQFTYFVTYDTEERELAGPAEGAPERLLTAQLALLDEPFRASSPVLNLLLSAIEQRRVARGALHFPVPMMLFVGTVGAFPEDGEREALLEQFVSRHEVKPLRADHRFIRMLTATARAGEGKGGGEEGAALTLGQLELLQALLPRVELPVPLLRELVELRHALMARGVPVSDRRFARALGPMRAQALLAGRERCGVEELPLLCHILWNEPEERVEISEALERITGGRQAERH